MEDNRYNNFKYHCSNINISNIISFKNNESFNSIIENVSYSYGLNYLNNIMKYNLEIDWDKIKLINDIGNPNNNTFFVNNNKILLSSTTLRYIQFTLDILNHIKNTLNLNTIKFVEVGGGYGAQAIFLFELCNLFNITIENYEIIDLQEVNNLQQCYIDQCSVINKDYPIEVITIDEYEYDDENYFISNYALGEFTKKWQDRYINDVASKIIHGYICWNFSPENQKIHEYFDNIEKIIEEENPQTNCPPVKSYIIKY